MSRKFNRFLAFLLTLALVTTTFSSDYASTRSFAVGSEEELEQISEDSNEESSELQWEDIDTDEETPAENEENESDIEANVETETEVSEGTPSDQATEGAVEEATADITNGGNVVEEPATAPAATEATASATEAVEASSEATSANGESTEAASAATSASIEEAADAASSASTEIEEKEQNLVTVKYKASMGGRVSVKEETVDLNDKDAKFEGSEATPWNDKYQFTEWVDEDGNFVTNDALLVPSDVEKDTTFTAKFMKLEEMPAISESKITGGMNVSVEADEGLFPEGTTVSIEAISDDKAMETAQDTLGDNVKEAKGVDIKFIYNEDEIQPADAQYVHVSISLVEKIEGTDFTVLHQHDGEVKEIEAAVATEEKNADPEDETKVATGVELDSNEFSVFIVAGTAEEDDGENNRFVITYKFMIPGSAPETWIPFAGHEEQLIKSGDILHNPGTPTIDTENDEEFNGWYTMDDDGNFIEANKVAFGRIDDVSETKVINVYANISTTYYVTFVGIENDVVRVKRQEGIKGQPATRVQVTDVPYAVKTATQAFMGWTTVKDDISTRISNSVDPSVNKTVYAYVTDAYWIQYDENDDTYDEDGNKIENGGASFVGPVAIDTKMTPREVVGTIPEPTRPGYDFAGWYNGTRNPETMAVTLTGPFDWDAKLTKDVTIFATWTEKTGPVKYYVNVWKQNVNGTGYDYDSSASFSATANPNATIIIKNNNYSVGGSNKSYPAAGTGFSLAKKEVIDGTGNTTGVVGVKEDTVINLYYNRNQYTLTFQEDNGYWSWGRWHENWETVYTITALYGQDISDRFPIKVGNRTYNNLWKVATNSSTYTKGLLVAKIENMPSENITFRKDDEGEKHAIFVYYREDLDGDYDTEFNEYRFDENNKVEFDCDWLTNSTEDEEFMNIEGFDRFAANPEYDSDGEQPIYHNEPINLYYTRKRYDLTFMDGNTPLGKVESIPYEQKLSLYSDEIDSIDVPDKDGQKFVGWFLDKTGNTEAKLSTATMPLNGLTVYAKYADVEFNVTLDLDGGTFDGSTDFWVNYGAKVDSNELTQKAEKTGEELVGWFYADGPKAGQAYEFGPVTESTTPLVYDAAYGTYTGTVHLVARWRSPGLVYIKYDAGANGTDAPTNDKYGYAYSSSVVVDKPSKANSGFNFIGWVIDNGSLEYDEDGNVIVNDSDILYPNGSFKIDRSVVTTVGDKEYITLVAVYERTGGANSSTATTTITYHSNDGKANTKPIAKVGDKDLRVNQSVEVLTLEEAFGEGYAREGYEFIGWNTDKDASTASVKAGQDYKIAADNEDASTSNTKANVLYAIWTKKKHNVTYEITGTIIPDGVTAPTGETNIEYGIEVTVKDALSAEGYTFSGWTTTDVTVTDGKFNMPDKDVKFTGSFTANRHNVTYEITGNVIPEGVTAPTGETDVAYGTEVTVKDALSAAGYTFSGWTTNDATVTAGKFDMPDKDVAFTGSFTANSNVAYKIQWLTKDADGNDKTLRDEETRTDGTTGQSASATDADKIFPGYTYDAASSTDSVIVKGDGSSVIKLYFTVNRHNVTYAITGDVIPEGVTAPTGETNVAYGTEVTVKEDLSAAGYTFTGWTTNDATVVDGKFEMPDGDVAFTGKFAAKTDVTYKVQWLTKDADGNDKTLKDEETRTDGTTGQSASATDADKVFPGYTYDAESSTDSVIVKGDGSSVIKLYFTVNRHNVTYAITGNVIPEGVTAPTGDTEVAYGTEVTVKGDLSAAGYTFSGWTTDDATVVDGKFSMPDGNVAFTGSFTANTNVEYKVQWLTKNENGQDVPLRTEETRNNGTTGQSASATDADKVFPGYTYDAESSTDSVIVKGDGSSVIKLYFTVNRHNVTYAITGDVIPEGVTAPEGDTEVAYGTEVTVKDALSAAGYTFSGWTTTDATIVDGKFEMPDNNVVFSGSFTIDESKSYKAKYVSANTAYGTVNPAEDAEASQVLGTANVKGSTATAKTGYKFTGWYVGNTKVGDNAVLTEAEAKANVAKEGNIYKETTFTAHFDVDKGQTKTLSYKVQHSVAGTVQTADTQEYKATVWVNDPDTIEVKTGSLAKKEYTGYKYDSQDPAEVTEGSLVNDGRVITLNYVRDNDVTKTVGYVVQYEIDGVVDANNSKAYSKKVWVNDPDTITVEAGSLEQKTFEGYKFIGQNPANIKEGDEVKNETVITLRYQKDEDQTKDVAYTVNHVVDGTVRDTANYPAKVWVNDPSEIEVTKDSLAAKDYVGYEVQDIEVVGSDVVISEDVVSKVTDGTVINLIYGPRTYTVRYEYRFATDDRPDTLPALPASFEVKYGQEFDVIDVPTIEGYTLTFWSMEEDKENTSVISKMIDAFQKFLDIITGKIKASAAGTTMKAPAYNAVIYTVISANPAPTPTPTPTGGDDPTPAGGDDPTPAAPTPVTPAPVAAAPAAAVLGATREGTAANGAAVLGSRRAKTDDQTDDTSRAFAIVIAAAVAISLFVTRRKKEEE